MTITAMALVLALRPTVAVTLNTGVVNARQAAAEIGRLLDQKLAVGAEFADEVVFLRVSEATSDRVLSVFGELLGGEWRTVNGVQTLSKNAASDSRARSEETSRQAQRIKEQLDRVRSPGLNQPWSKVDREAVLKRKASPVSTMEDYVALVRRSNQVPAGRALIRLIDRIDLKRVASMIPGESRDVGSGLGTPRIPFYGDIGPILRQWNEEEAEFYDALSGTNAASREDFLSDGLGLFYERTSGPPQIASAYLRVARPFDGQWQFRLTGADANGRRVVSKTLSLQFMGQMPSVEALPPGDWQKAPFEPSPEVEAAFRLSHRTPLGVAKPKYLEDVTQADPLRFFVQPWIERAWPEGDLAACFGDEALGAFDAVYGPTPLAAVAQRCLFGHRIEKKNGLTWIRPEFPLATREGRVSRAPLQRFVTAARRELRVPLALVANYVAEQRPEANVTVFERIALLLLGFDIRGQESMYGIDGVSMGYREFFRFFAGRNPSQMEALERGEAIPYARLAPAQRAAIERAVFARDRTLRHSSTDRSPRDPLKEFITEYPTYAMPFGIPADSTVTLKKGSNLAMFQMDGDQIGRGWESSSLGYIYFQQADKGQWLDGSGGYVPVDRTLFRPGLLENYVFTVHFPGIGETAIMLRDEWIDPAGKAVGFQNFPPEHKAAFEKTLARYRSQALAPSNVPPP